MRRWRNLAFVLGLACLAAVPAFSYLTMFTRAGGVTVLDRWDMTNPVEWNLNPQRRDNIRGGRSLSQVMQASFGTWAAAPNAAVRVARGADTNSTSDGFDSGSDRNENLICFVCSADFEDHAETLAITITTVSTGTGGSDGRGGQVRFAGQILDSDILFNPERQFTTDLDTEVEDLETIATHEVGHLLGLDHSGVVRAIMFPFAPPVLRTLSYDDVAGIAVVYPKPAPDVATGAISGRIRDAGGAGVFGAHVYAEAITGAQHYGGSIRKTPVGAMTAADGSYTIEGLPPDTYIVTAEPLDQPVTEENIEGYARAFGQDNIRTDFISRWF